jgi:hypothetical protein
VAYLKIQSNVVTLNGIVYESEYDLSNGKTRIIQTNAPTGTQPIYQDGNFTAESTKIGLTDITQRQNIHNSISAATRAAHSAAGGTPKGYVLPTSAQSNNQGAAPGSNLATPTTNPDPNNASANSNNGFITAVDAIKNLPNDLAKIADPFGNLKNLSVNGNQFGVSNESAIFGRLMKYPNDMDITRQDYLVIDQFRYTPPNAESIFAGADDIWAKGLNRGSDRLTQSLGKVYLPMPNTVQDSNTASWDGSSMNNIAAGAMADVGSNLVGYGAAAGIGAGAQGLTGVGSPQLALQAMMIARAVGGGAAGNQVMQTLLGADMTSKLLSMIGQGVDVETIFARGAGVVPNSNLEYLFRGPALRTFNNFNWRMTARSVEESSTIRHIIRFFKQGMAPKKQNPSNGAGAAAQLLGTPNVFKLEYKTGSKTNDAVNKFKTCALVAFNTNYTPDSFWAAYDEGQPLSVSISMQFNELEPIYDSDYQTSDKFSLGRTDLSSISDESVGY